MARPKRTSAIHKFAVTRAAALKSISATLDLGEGLTLAEYQAAIDGLKAKNDNYNTKLSELDGLLNELEADEKAVEDLSSRMLAGVGVKFTKESNEYEKAGGTRKSERKKPVRKPKAVTE